MQFIASYVELWGNPGYRGYARGKLQHAQSQVRGQAWGLRSIADAAFATPDADPLKAYFRAMRDNILDDYNARYTDNKDDSNPLRVLDDYGAVVYSMGGQQRVGIAPWQQDFFVWSVGHVAEQGSAKAARFLDWLASFQIGMMLGAEDDPDNGYCWVQASTYQLRIQDRRGSAMVPDLATAYRMTHPRLAGLACGSQQMANAKSALDHRYVPGEMSGYAHSATGYPANLQIGLAMAAGSRHPQGTRAWQIFEQRRIKPDYANKPKYAVVPRYTTSQE